MYHQYQKYFDLLGLTITNEDLKMVDESDRIVYVSIDHNKAFFDSSQNETCFPIKIDGKQIATMWWMYRLSERKCTFEDYLAEHLIPICRKFFVQEQKKRKKDLED